MRALLLLAAAVQAYCFVFNRSVFYRHFDLGSLLSGLSFNAPKDPSPRQVGRDPGPFELMNLPYEMHELAPDISEETVKLHYLKHHQGYVNKLNELGKVYPHIFNYSLEDLIMWEDRGSKVYNMACQVWNHDFYWLGLDPSSTGRPSQFLEELMQESFGGFEQFKRDFTSAASSHFGSGWVWLLHYKYKPHLRIVDTHDADNPVKLYNMKPLLVLDVWEHAYYVDYRNDRSSYTQGWFRKVNWARVEELVREQMR